MEISWVALPSLLFLPQNSVMQAQRLLHRSAEDAVIKLFKSPFEFWRDSGNSPGDEVYFSPLVPGFEEFPFFSLLKAGLSEKPLLEETLVCAHTT